MWKLSDHKLNRAALLIWFTHRHSFHMFVKTAGVQEEGGQSGAAVRPGERTLTISIFQPWEFWFFSVSRIFAQRVLVWLLNCTRAHISVRLFYSVYKSFKKKIHFVCQGFLLHSEAVRQWINWLACRNSPAHLSLKRAGLTHRLLQERRTCPPNALDDDARTAAAVSLMLCKSQCVRWPFCSYSSRYSRLRRRLLHIYQAPNWRRTSDRRSHPQARVADQPCALENTFLRTPTFSEPPFSQCVFKIDRVWQSGISNSQARFKFVKQGEEINK